MSEQQPVAATAGKASVTTSGPVHSAASPPPQAASGLGQILKVAAQAERVGRFDQAETLYKRLLADHPGHPAALRGLGVMAMRRRRLDEAIDLLRRAVAAAPAHPDLHNDLGSALGEAGRSEEAVAEFRRALELRPNRAEVHGNLGVALQRLGKVEESIAAHRRAVELSPRSAGALTRLAAALMRQDKLDEAGDLLRRAISVKPDLAEAHGRLGNVLRLQGKLSEAMLALRTAIRLRPNYPEAHVHLGLACLDVNDAQGAVESFGTAVRLKPDYTEAHWNYGLSLLLAGDWARGWTEYEWRRPLKHDPQRRRDAPIPLWDGSDPRGKTLLVHTEQGFGDTIMFIRYAASLAERGAKVAVQCRPELKRLVATVPGVIAAAGPGDKLPECDAHVALMSLPAIFGTTQETVPGPVPFIVPDAQETERWRRQLANDQARLKVGLVWGANPKPLPTRTSTLAEFAPLAQVNDVSFYSLQKGEHARQAANPPKGMTMVDLTFGLNDFADTAAFIANLDLVITVDTSVLHVAGALGKPVWILLPHVADWRWMLDRDDSPWYPSAKLFRQTRAGDWAEVMQRVAQDLARLAAPDGPERHIAVEMEPAALLERIALLQAKADVETDGGAAAQAVRALPGLLAVKRREFGEDANVESLVSALREGHAARLRAEKVLRTAANAPDQLMRATLAEWNDACRQIECASASLSQKLGR